MSFESPNCISDEDLLLLLQSGKTETLGVLYDRHASLVYGISLKLLGTQTEAEELTQDIFLNLANKSAYNPQRGTLRTYLAIFTRTRALERLKSRSQKQRQLYRQSIAENLSVLSKNPLEGITQFERSQEIKSALEQLSAKEQEILMMAYYQGLSQFEIAKQLNLTLETVKFRSRCGLLKLRQALIALRR